eukprot:TRINITY_DN26831_c0_g1_i1.p1 TRINITY_DN26831_c0_g1~~TRINITY_DN26831_c0_g1_i1.p1  ORF type:complete len:261 (+),score=65.59 TRINITY_DN26831_c0_g1_i1:57-839(+)
MGNVPCNCPPHCDAILVDEEDLFEFRNVPYNSWIPSSLLAIASISLGAVLIHLTSAQLWFVSLVLWVVGGVMLAKVKYERCAFDKMTGTVRITRRGITGTRVKTYNLSNIKEIIYEKERDLQGGDDVQLFMKLENGKEVKIVAGHFCGIRPKLKKHIKRKLDKFLEGVPKFTEVEVHHKERKVSRKKKDTDESTSDSFDSSYPTSEDSSFGAKSHKISHKSSKGDRKYIIDQEDEEKPEIIENRGKDERGDELVVTLSND